MAHLICPRVTESIQPRIPDVVDFSRCNNADINWYIRMPTDPP